MFQIEDVPDTCSMGKFQDKVCSLPPPNVQAFKSSL